MSKNINCSILCLILLVLYSYTGADVVFESARGTNPTEAGFVYNGPSAVLKNYGYDTEPYWFLRTTEKGGYNRDVPTEVFSNPDGWTFTLRSKSLSYNHTDIQDNWWCVRDMSTRWDLLGIAGDGINAAGVHSLTKSGWILVLPSLDVTQYHTYQIIYNPAGNWASGTASIYIDGLFVRSFTRDECYPATATATDLEVRGGDGSGINTGGHEKRYSLIRLETGQRPFIPLAISKTAAAVEEDPLSISEDSYTITLGEKPLSTVTVRFDVDDGIMAIEDLVFAVGDLNVPKTISIKAIDNNTSDGLRHKRIRHTVTSTDPWFNEYVLSDVVVQVKDNELWCGQPDTVFSQGDINQDCYVDLFDVSILSSNWMKCTSPFYPSDCDATEFATILQTQVIAREQGRYCAWPSITQAFDGKIIVSYTGGSNCHGCSPSLAKLVSSDDGGATWSMPYALYDINVPIIGVGIYTTSKGTNLLCWTDRSVPREMIARSSDNGLTWGRDTVVPVLTPHGFVELIDGRLLYVSGLGVYHSLDEGYSWSKIAHVYPNPDDLPSLYASLSETHACQTKSGKIVALHRYRNDTGDGDSNLRQFESNDGGFTWTTPHKTDMVGYPAHLLTLNNGWLLASYGRRLPPMGQRACVSYDEGQTWDTGNEIVISNLRDDVSNNAGHLGYPASLQLSDGTILTVYYQINEPADGEFPSIICTHWKLNGIF